MTAADLFVEKVEEIRRLRAMRPRDDAEATALVDRMIAIEASLGETLPRTRDGVIAGLRFVADHAAEGGLDEGVVVALLDAAVDWIEGAGGLTASA